MTSYIGNQLVSIGSNYTRADASEVVTGSWTFTQDLNCVATRSRYADLAERYSIDKKQPLGTIVSIGGDKEITIADGSKEVYGVLSTNPAIKMNSDAGDDIYFPYVGLVGRLPLRVVDKVSKGDILVLSDIDGVAVKTSNKLGEQRIGYALEDKTTVGESLVEVALRF